MIGNNRCGLISYVRLEKGNFAGRNGLLGMDQWAS